MSRKKGSQRHKVVTVEIKIPRDLRHLAERIRMEAEDAIYDAIARISGKQPMGYTNRKGLHTRITPKFAP